MAKSKDDMLRFAAVASGLANYDIPSSHTHRLARVWKHAYLHMVEWEKESGHE
jgi:hypothetical protein